MEEEKADDIDIEKNNEEEDKSKEDESEKKDADESDEDSEYIDPYEAELKRLEEEKTKAEAISRQKAGALKEEREKRVDLEKRLANLEAKLEKGKDVNVEEVAQRLRNEISIDREIESLSSNPSERKLIREYMKAKNLTVEEAYVLANKHVVVEAKKKEAESDQEDAVLARLSGANPGGGKDKIVSRFAKIATDGLTPEEAKHLDF